MRFQLLETEQQQVQLMSGFTNRYVRLDGEWKMRFSKYTLLSNLQLQGSDAGLGIIRSVPHRAGQ